MGSLNKNQKEIVNRFKSEFGIDIFRHRNITGIFVMIGDPETYENTMDVSLSEPVIVGFFSKQMKDLSAGEVLENPVSGDSYQIVNDIVLVPKGSFSIERIAEEYDIDDIYGILSLIQEAADEKIVSFGAEFDIVVVEDLNGFFDDDSTDMNERG